MKYSNTIEYNISTKLDASGLTKFQAELQKIELSLQNKANRQLLPAGEVEKAREQLNGLSQALTKAFNPSLGIIDLSKLRSSLSDSVINAKSLSEAFKLAGTDGEVAFNNLLGQLGKFDSGIARSNSSLDKLYTTMSNTFRWGLVSSFFSQFMNGIHSSIEYVKDLDESLTQIMLVTDYNRDSMNEYAKSANEAAKALSMSTVGMTNASLVFAQQGFDLNQSQQLAELSAKLANASQQDTATTSDQITAYMNAYGLENSIEELTQQMDNWALIANVSAADVGELAQASQRAASMANAVGVSGEQLAAQIATIESVTREAPEQIGNGLKTLYARFSDIASGKEDEDGFTLGKVTSELQKIGVQVLDSMGQIRDVGDIMEDLMVIWDDLDQTSKVAASQALAGKYQVNRFMALMDNTDMYQEYKGATGDSAAGTLDQMNQEYANSLAGRLQKLQTTFEGIFSDLFDTDDFYKFIDVAQGALDLINDLTEAMGGGIPVLTALVGLMAQAFSKNIAQEITRSAQNRELDKIRIQNAQNVGGVLSDLGLEDVPSEASRGIVNFVQQGAQNYSSMSPEQVKQYNQLLDSQVTAASKAAEANKNLANTIMEVGAAAGIGLKTSDALFTGERGELNTSNLLDAIANTGKGELSQIKPEEFAAAAKEAGGFAKSLAEINDAFEIFKNDGSADNFENLSKKIEVAKDKLAILHETGAISDETFERMSSILDDAASHMEDWDSETDEAIKDIRKLNLEAIDLNEILKGLASGDIKWDTLDESIQKAILKAQNARAVAEGAQSMGQAFFEGLDVQKATQQLIDNAGAMVNLISVYTSFKNLGSLWTDEDVANGERVLQTVLNLATTLPRLVPVVNDLTTKVSENLLTNLDPSKKISTLQASIESIGKRNVSIQEHIKAIEEKRATVNKQIQTLQERYGKDCKQLPFFHSQLNNLEKQRFILQKQLAAGIVEQQTAEKGIEAIENRILTIKRAQIAATIGISAALMIISAGIGAIQEQERKRVQKITDDADEARSMLDGIKSSSFFSEWDNFKENGELTDSLKESMADLAQQMGINIEAQDIYAGNIESLNDKIRENIELEKERAGISLVTENNEYEFNLNKNSQQAQNIGTTITTASGIHDSAVDYVGQAGAMKTLSERMGELADSQDKVNEARRQFGTDSVEYNKALADYTRIQKQLQDADVDISKVKENYKQLGNLAIEGFKDGRDTEEISGAEWIEFLNSDGWVQDYLNSLGKESAIQFKMGILSETDKENPIYSMIKGPGEFDFSNANLSTTEETNLDLSSLISSGLDPTELGYNTWDEFIQAFMDKANNAEIIISPKIKLGSTYDFDSDQEIEEYLKNNTNIDRATLDVATQIRVDEYAQEGNTQNGYADAANWIVNQANAEVNRRQEEVTQAKDNLISDDFETPMVTNLKNYEEATRELTKAQEELTESQKTLHEANEDTTHDAKQYEKAMQQSAAAAARMVKTLDEMGKHFDNNKEILEEGNKSTIDYAEALTQIKEDLAGLLDIDASMLSNDFASSEEALSKMNVMLHGTKEEAEAAYEELRALAAEDIIDNLELNIPVGLKFDDGSDVTPEAVDQILTDMVNSLNAQDLQIGMDATINTEDWYAKVNELLESGVITEQQLTNILSAAGYKGRFDTYTKTAKVPITTYEVTPNEGTVKIGDMEWPSGFKMVPKTEYEEQEVQVPVLEGATQMGGFDAQGGGSHQSPSGGGGGSCFVAGTLISMKESSKFIEDIQIGDIVLSYNETTKTNEYSKVLQTMIHDTTEEIYSLYIEDEILSVTGIHRFYIRRKHEIQWIMASDLKIGDYILLANGTWQPIWKIKVKIQTLTVYNFEVSYNHNYYVGKNQILAHNKGGGGGGGKSKEPKTIEPKEKKTHEKDYYEEVDSQLEKTEAILSKIEGENDRLTGDKARANYDKQIKLLQKEIKLQQQKLKIMQEQELADVDKSLTDSDKEAEKVLKDAGITFEIPDIEFDEDGVISNYEDISAAIDEGHNKLIDAYNEAAKAGDEERTKAIEKQIQEYDKWGAKILEDARRHDELQGEIEDTKKTLEDLEDAIEDIAIAVYQASQEAIDNLKDLREGWSEMEGFFSGLDIDSPFRALIEDGYKLDEIYTTDKEAMEDYYDSLIAKEQQVITNSEDEDEIAAAQRNIEFYQGQKANLKDGSNLENGLLGLAQQDLARLTQWMNNPEDPSNPFGENTKALEEAHKAAYDRVREMTLEYEKWVAEYRDNLIDVYNDIYDRQKEIADKFDDIVDDLERSEKAYTLYYGDDSYDAIAAIEGQKYDTLIAQRDVLEQREADWHAQMLLYYDEEGKLREGVDEKVAKEVRANYEETVKERKEKDLEAAQAAQAAYEASIDAAVKHAKDAFAANIDVGFGTGMAWDDLKQTWERQKDYNSRYKDDIERSYEVDKLRSKYLDLLDNAQNASLTTQRKIRQQMEEQIDLLENQTTMSQYDVDLANAKYNILQKQIALEEAQQNKNQMKLKRDAQGNYSYVYTANQDDVRAAENDLLDTEYDAYELTKNATIQNTDRLLSEWENYLAQRAEIEKKYSAQDEETQAKKEVALRALEEQWNQTREALMEDFSDTNAGMRDILTYMMDSSVNGAKEMLESLEEGNNEVLNAMGAQWMVWGTQIEEMLTDPTEGIIAITQDANDKMGESWETYTERMDDAIEDISGSVDSYNDIIDSAQDAVSDLADEQERLNEALQDDWMAVDEARERLEQYEAQLAEAKDSMSSLRQELQAAYEARDQAEAAKLNYETILDDIRKGRRDKDGKVIESDDDDDDSGGKGKGKKEKLKESVVREVYDLINEGVVSWGYPQRANDLKSLGYNDRYIDAGQDAINHVYPPSLGGYGDMTKEQAIKAAAAKFKTGGYTGVWNKSNGLADEGRLAVLHEKELVLNKTDTENILEAVKYMRDFANTQLDRTTITSNLLQGFSDYVHGDTIEQRVEITATFPNVNAAKEIEEALLGLADKAYQYAHRNTFKDMKLNY